MYTMKNHEIKGLTYVFPVYIYTIHSINGWPKRSTKLLNNKENSVLAKNEKLWS